MVRSVPQVAGLGARNFETERGGAVCVVVLLQSTELRVCHERSEDLIMWPRLLHAVLYER
jgi:hypothetical protein